MPPSCGLLEPHGWLVPAAVFQPHSLLDQGWWWLWALGAAGGRARGSCLAPAQQHSSHGGVPSWFCRSAVALLVFIQLHMSYLNLLLEKPLCYLKHILRAFWCFFITLERNVVILTFDYLWWFASAVAFLQPMFSFFGLKRFSPRCAAPVPRWVHSNPWQHPGPRHKHEGWMRLPALERTSPAPIGLGTPLRGWVAPYAPSWAARSPCPWLGFVC